MVLTAKIVLLGLGKVGQSFLRQVLDSALPLEFIALADSSAFLMGSPINYQQIEEALLLKHQGSSLSTHRDAQPLQDLARVYLPGTIVVDTSAARQLDLLPALHAGCKLVFANKNALSAPWMEAEPYYNSNSVNYEATVGAGLPVINTIRTMLACGDEIIRIEGVMSGTLGFLCSRLEAGTSYSTAVRAAFEAGYTEPDPRDDLSGFDVARKALILARTAGWHLEKSHLHVEELYDQGLARISTHDFFETMVRMDSVFQGWVIQAGSQNKVLRYVAAIDSRAAHVGLHRVDKQSSLGSLQGTANYFAIYSKLYPELPLVISGPGAGVEVTAAGVLADVLRANRCASR